MDPKRLLNYFLNGLLLSVPLVVVLYVIYQLFMFMDDLILPFLNPGKEPADYNFRGFGFVILVAVLMVLGYFGNTLIAKPIQRSIDRLLDRIPLIKTLYNNKYTNWLVVEAEQDPIKANPLEYAKIGFNYLSKTLTEVGYNI